MSRTNTSDCICYILIYSEKREEKTLSQDTMMTISEAAETFDIPRMKIYRWIKFRRLSAFRSGRDERAKLIRRADVEALLQPELVDVSGTADLKSAA